jgi:hypothetical protein
MVGVVEQHAFTKVLADDYAAVMQGISIEYGSQIKGTKDISLSMGWEKPRKRRIQEVKNGRPPDIYYQHLAQEIKARTTKELSEC